MLLFFKSYCNVIGYIKSFNAIVVNMAYFNQAIALRPVPAEYGDISPRFINGNIPGNGSITVAAFFTTCTQFFQPCRDAAVHVAKGA